MFVPAEADLTAATFYLDDPTRSELAKRIDTAAPFDYGGSKSSGAANLVRFPRGQHQLTVALLFSDGFIDVVTVSFTAN